MQITPRRTLRRERRRQILKVCGIAFLLILIVAFVVIFRAQQPLRSARQHSIARARQCGVTNVTNFYAADLNRPYYTVGGYNRHHEKRYVIVSRKYHKLKNVRAANGIGRNAVVSQVRKLDHPEKIMNAGMEVFNGKPVWVVGYLNQNRKLCYQTFNYSTGKSIQLITNV